jgi:aminoglycoside phosphotransferase (APT) family kinase protein
MDINIKEKADSLKNKIIDVLHSDYPELKVQKVVPFAHGVENIVFKGESKELGMVAIRTPIVPYVDNENDGCYHSRLALEKELSLLKHAGSHGLPVPRVYGSHFSDEIDFIITEFVVSDGKTATDREIGSLLSKLHRIPIPEYHVTNQTEGDLVRPIAERIVQRTKVVEKWTHDSLVIPLPEDLLNIFTSWKGKTALLHLDVRPANYMTVNGKIKATVDWSNSLIGDPCLEMMRILVQEELGAAFLQYYDFKEYLKEVPEIIQTLYRYDAEVMMTVLFLSEIQDAKMGEYYYRKLLSTHRRLMELI